MDRNNGRNCLTPVCRLDHQLRGRWLTNPSGRPAHHSAPARDSNQRVNDRLADLGEEVTARGSGAQGVYPSHYNDYQSHCHNPHMSQPHINMQHGNQVQGEVHPAPKRNISSGRDRTGNDNIHGCSSPGPTSTV